MKRKSISTILGILLVFALIVGTVLPLASAASVTVNVLNPLANLEPFYNQPLTSRDRFTNEDGEIDFNGKIIGLSAYSKVGNAQGIQALGLLLMEEYPGVKIVNTGVADLGSPWNNKTDVNYNLWAGVTALGNSARAMLPDGTNEAVSTVAGQKLDAVIFGFGDCNVCTWWSSYHTKEVEERGGIATIVLQGSYASTHAYAAVDNGFTQVRRIVVDRQWNSKAYMLAGVSNNACRDYYKDYTMVNLPAEPEYAEISQFTGERAWLNNTTPYEQMKWALSAPLTEAEKNPTPITQETFNQALSWQTKNFSGATYEKAAQEFNSYAMENLFGDGLPLVLPTEELVNEMLAGTTRDRNEILGKIKMRGGVITIEKIAINTVMAGAKPEHMPVLIAAMEVYANGWENDKMWYHNMSTGAYSVGITVVLNGPLAKELGVSDGRGVMGAGHEANNLIGRAFRMCIRNIGHNYTPNVDTQNRLGRLNDITLTVFAENEDKLPDGWKPHHVMMGYEEEESTITMIGTFTRVECYNAEDNTNRWTPQSLMQDTRAHATTTASLVLIAPGIAAVMADEELAGDYYMDSKEAIKEWYATHNATSGSTNRSAGIYNMTYPIVVGDDPSYIGSMYGFEGLYATLCYQTQLISGATLTQAGQGATAPSTPQNFAVAYNEDGTEATLTWDAPLSDGGDPIVSYQVCNIHGGTRQNFSWTTVPGGADARSYTFTNLVPGAQGFFKVRANNSIHNASEFVTATTAMNTTRASGRGAWATIIDTSGAKVAMTVLRIDGAALVSVKHNSTMQFKAIANPGASTDGVVWSIADTSYATVDEDGLVTTLNKLGTVMLTATDAETGLSYTVVIRII